MSPKTIEAYRISLECFLDYLVEAEHLDRTKITFEHLDRPRLKGWLAWMTEQRALRAAHHRLAAQRRQSVPGLLLPAKTSPCSRSAKPPKR